LPVLSLAPLLLHGPPIGKVPVQARSRSDKHAAVLRLQRTQPKDRRVYTALTGILADRRPMQKERSQGQHRQNQRADGKGMLGSYLLFICIVTGIGRVFHC
ncbi:hypothetical protein, partial [Eisenbergiella tayi]|uniref:hypothetical protein n=2 Tax=Eisenbergiella tayi TaxID=1432052 RepID=UPI0028A5155C